jgi:RHS repeat-associated protein
MSTGENDKKPGCVNGDPYYTYDKLDRVTSMTSPVGITQYHYGTTTGQLDKITSPQGKEFAFSYDHGQLASIERPNGVTSEYSFDDNGNLTSIDHRLGGSSLRSYSYGYDKNGMRESMMDNDGTHEYTYDPLYQIIEATHPTPPRPLEQFLYDEVGNRLGGGRVHNELNQLTEDDSCSYAYDADGNMILQVRKSTGDSTKFTWDVENKLTKGEMPNGTIVEYVYGPLGRRLAKVVNDVRKEYRYDGMNLILETDEEDSILANYTFGPGLDHPLMMHRNNKDYYYLSDGQGSITAITNEGGDVLQEYWYSVFGEVLAQSADSIENPFTYTARESDIETGLMYYRARFFNPQIGRFISEDPIGLNAGDYNLYRYVSNNSINMKDPIGWEQCSISGIYIFDVNVDVTVSGSFENFGISTKGDYTGLKLNLWSKIWTFTGSGTGSLRCSKVCSDDCGKTNSKEWTAGSVSIDGIQKKLKITEFIPINPIPVLKYIHYALVAKKGLGIASKISEYSTLVKKLVESGLLAKLQAMYGESPTEACKKMSE